MGPEHPDELKDWVIYVLPHSGRYVFAGRPEGSAWVLSGDDLPDEPNYQVRPDGTAYIIGKGGTAFHIRELREELDCRPIYFDLVCGEFAFPDHGKVCPGPDDADRS